MLGDSWSWLTQDKTGMFYGQHSFFVFREKKINLEDESQRDTKDKEEEGRSWHLPGAIQLFLQFLDFFLVC